MSAKTHLRKLTRCTPLAPAHDGLDGNVPLDHAELVADRVRGAKLHVVEDFFTLSNRAQQVRDGFLKAEP